MIVKTAGWLYQKLRTISYTLEHWHDEQMRKKRRKSRNDDDCVEADDDTPSGKAIPTIYQLLSHERKWSFHHAQIGALMREGEMTLFTHSFPYVEVAMFTGAIFAAHTGRDKDSIACMYEPVYGIDPDNYRRDAEPEYRHCKGRLIFNKETYEAFTQWLVEYKTRLPEGFDFTQMLPVVEDGNQVGGYFVDHHCDFEPRRGTREHQGKFLPLADGELFDEWLWMLNNTHGKVRILADKWVFEDASDAMLYQMQMR